MPIEVVHLTHCYSEGSALSTVALNDVSFRIEDGEFIGIIGHTGSGKSTLVQHLNGLLKPSSGQVLIDGEDLNGEHVNRRALRQKIGLVFQYPEYQLFEETVAKDIAFGPKNQGLPAAEISERVRYAMDCVHLNYDKYAERSPFELSGGQMRRVAIAGVLAMRPSVLATRLIVMSEGKVVAQGTPREIFTRSEMMTSIGLDVPEAARLCALLRSEGYDLPADLFRPEELKDCLLRLWKEGSSC